MLKKDEKNLTDEPQLPCPITRDTIIADVVQEYPETMDVFLEFGIHCVGCQISSYETVEQGILGHGYSEEDLDSFIEALNIVARSTDFSPEKKECSDKEE